MADATGSDGAVYVLNAGTMCNQFNSVCCTVDVNGDLWVSCEEMRKQNLKAYVPSWVANRTRVLITNSLYN